MLSRERAEFMVENLQKEIEFLKKREDYVSNRMIGESIALRITILKNDLKLFRKELIKMISTNTDCLIDDGNIEKKLIQNRVNLYKCTYSYDSFNNIEVKKSSVQKTKCYHV